MTIQDILDELDESISSAGAIEEAVKKSMPGYEVAAYDDDEELGDSYSTAEIIASFIQNNAQDKVLKDIDLGNILCDDDNGYNHSYTVIAVKAN